MPLFRTLTCRALWLFSATLLFVGAAPSLHAAAPLTADPEELCTPRAEHTGNHATLILPVEAVDTNGTFTPQEGDRVAAFTEEGLCVGETVWTGENVALTLWGNDGMTQTVDGLRSDEAFTLAFYSQELSAIVQGNIALSLVTDRPHFRPEPTYAPDAIYLVQRLEVAPEVTG